MNYSKCIHTTPTMLSQCLHTCVVFCTKGIFILNVVLWFIVLEKYLVGNFCTTKHTYYNSDKCFEKYKMLAAPL